MQPSAKRALSILLSAALLITSLVIYATLISPEYERVNQLRGELESKTLFLEEERTAITQVQNLIAQYQSVSRLGESLSLALPNEESVSSVIAQINAMAGSSGVLVQSVGINNLPIKPPVSRLSSARGLGTLRLQLDLAGSYSGIKRFLQLLETNIRIMDVRSLTIGLAGRPDQDIYLYTLTVDTYYQPQ